MVNPVATSQNSGSYDVAYENAEKSQTNADDANNDSAIETVKTGALIAGSLTPGVGEAIDLYTLFHPESTGLDRVLSAASLALSVATVGMAPNFGAAAKIGRRIANAGGDAQVVAQQTSRKARALARLRGKKHRLEPPGEKGNWNTNLRPKRRPYKNGKDFEEKMARYQPFEPNAVYEVGSFIYETNRNGLVERVIGTLQKSGRARNTSAQKTAGWDSRWISDQGGHLIASVFGGPGEGINLIAQNVAKNSSEFKKVENAWGRAMSEGTVTVDIKVVYGNRFRPTHLNVNSYVDGRPLHTDVRVSNYNPPT